LLNSKKAAAFLGISERMLERLRTAGEGPKYVKFGMVVRYDPADILAWIEGRKRASTSDCSGETQGRRRRKACTAPAESQQTSTP
jgi:predicted DNA-binding transcriptional regulator AlpA